MSHSPSTSPFQAVASAFPVASVFTTTAQPAMSQYQPRGAIDLPIEGTKGAPKKFKGRSGEVEHFLQHYEKLCAKHAVTAPQEKIENMTQYCSRQVREFLEGLSSYSAGDWTRFKKDFKEFFNADKDDRRFRVKDLEKYVTEARSKPAMRDLVAWRKYSRGFIRISGWLEQHHKITADENATYFWKGIPRKFRERLEHRLMGQNPTHDISKPFDIERIEKVAKALLQRDRFDRERLPSDDSDDSDDEDSSDDDSSDDETDESAEEVSHKKKKVHFKKAKKLAKKKARKAHESSDEDSDDESEEEIKTVHRKFKKGRKTSAANAPTDHDKEVEQLIDQLNRMSVTDPGYAGIYFRACIMHPMVQSLVPPPSIASQQPVPRSSPSFNVPRESPPHFERRLQPGYDGQQRVCYGCGETGHGMFLCPKMMELEGKKVIKRDGRGRWVMLDGSNILRKDMTESIASAVQQLLSTQTNYIAVPSQYYPSQTNYVAIHQPYVDIDKDEEVNEVYPCVPDYESSYTYSRPHDQ